MAKHLRHAWLATPILLGVIAAVSYAAYRWLTPPALPDGLLYGNGRIEGTDVTVASQITGRVLESRLIEGALVSAGALLVRLEDTDFRSQLARAGEQREAVLRERDRLEDERRTAQHHLEIARRNDARFATLLSKGAVSLQSREQAANALSEARSRVDSLAAALVQADAQINAAQNTVALARSQLEKTTIRAPISGTILTKSIEAGELAIPGRPIATLVDLTRVKLKIYVPEQSIGELHLGDEARVRTDAFPQRLITARVSLIDSQAQFTPRDIHMPDERARLVFGVTLALDNPEGLLKPGMPADAWVRYEPAAAWPPTLLVPR